MAVDPITWANDMRGAIAQMAGAMRVIENASNQPEWDEYFNAWRHDPALSKSTRKMIKALLPSVISMSQDLDDPLLTEIGIDVSALPIPTSFGSQMSPEPRNLKIAQIDMKESPTETAHEILVLTKPTRLVALTIKQSSDGVAVDAPVSMVEVSAGVFTHTIDWSILAVAKGYYIVEVEDGFELDAALVELKSTTESHTQADKVWMLQNIKGSGGSGGGSAPSATAQGRFI